MAESKKKDLYVTAPLVEVEVKGGNRVQLYRGDLITDAVDPKSVELLESLGFVSSESPLNHTED